MAGKRNLTLEARLLQYVTKSDGCWLWHGMRKDSGYGRIKVIGKNVNVHRVAYELWVGQIHSGLHVDHTCFVRNCVNPSHLRLLTKSENSRLKKGYPKTHCIRGHELSGYNLIIRSDGARVCRQCLYIRVRAYKGRKREAAQNA